MCRWRSATGSSGSSLIPRTKASWGASVQVPSATMDAPAAAYSSMPKMRWGDSSTVTSKPASSNSGTSAGTTGARRSVPRDSDRIHTWTGCIQPGWHRRAQFYACANFAHTGETPYWVEPELVYDQASLERWLAHVLGLVSLQAQPRDVAAAHRLRASVLQLARARAEGRKLAAEDIETVKRLRHRCAS